MRSTLDDALRGLAPGLPPLPRAAARTALLGFGRRFRREILDADAAVATGGLPAAADLLLTRYSGPVTVAGAERVPADGPLLAVANHPGTVDTLAVWRALAVRRDLRVIALDRPFLRAIPNIARHLLYVADDGHQRSRLVREAMRHLRGGGALLVFPAGETEPDPAVRPEAALAALAGWSRSPELFARLVPGLPVLPLAVSGVLAERSLRHPVARLRRDPEARELAAATLQVVRADRSLRPRVLVGEPLRGRPDGLTEDLRATMAALFRA
nr:glycerol acyltransferase [Propionibacterium sp.]